MRTPYKILLGACLLVIVAKLAYAWWNPDELVTLHGRDIPVAEALGKFSSQTHRKILYPANLDQKVTLDLEKAPLEDALAAVSDQAELWHARLFVLSGDSGRKKALLEKLSKQIEQPVLMRLARGNRWQSDKPPAAGQITYAAGAKPIENAIPEINLATDSYFYFEGEPHSLTVQWVDTPVRQAAAELASLTGTDLERLYQFFPRDARRMRQGSGFGSPEGMRKLAEETTREIESLPAGEKSAAEAVWQKQQERWEAFAAMPEEQRIQVMMQRFLGGDPEKRLIERLKNSTPEQRAKRYKRFEDRRRARGNATPAPAPVPRKES